MLGDAEMMMDQWIEQGLIGNRYFVLTSMAWLMENEKLITIPPKEEAPRFLTMSSGQKRFIWALVVGIIPVAIGIAGFVVWWRRR
jgi:cytochrome b subunit of formate dehydrogenase